MRKAKALTCHRPPLHRNHTLGDKGLVPEEDSWLSCTPRGPWSNRLRTLVLNTMLLVPQQQLWPREDSRMLLRTDAFHCKFSGPQSNMKACWSPRPSPLQAEQFFGLRTRVDRKCQPEHHGVLDWGLRMTWDKRAVRCCSGHHSNYVTTTTSEDNIHSSTQELRAGPSHRGQATSPPHCS